MLGNYRVGQFGKITLNHSGPLLDPNIFSGNYFLWEMITGRHWVIITNFTVSENSAIGLRANNGPLSHFPGRME